MSTPPFVSRDSARVSGSMGRFVSLFSSCSIRSSFVCNSISLYSHSLYAGVLKPARKQARADRTSAWNASASLVVAASAVASTLALASTAPPAPLPCPFSV